MRPCWMDVLLRGYLRFLNQHYFRQPNVKSTLRPTVRLATVMSFNTHHHVIGSGHIL